MTRPGYRFSRDVITNGPKEEPMRTTIRLTVAIVLAASLSAVLPVGVTFGTSCERTVGGSSQDLKNVKTFCSLAIAKESESFIPRVVANQSILTIHVNRTMALTMKRGSLDTKRAVLGWMKMWRQITGHRVVSVYVEWEGVAIATGDFSLFGGGDRVTIH